MRSLALGVRRSNRSLRLQSSIFAARSDGLAAAADFWGHALGMEIRALPAEEGEKYVRLVDRSSEMHIEVQKVDHPSRVHLDIEAGRARILAEIEAIYRRERAWSDAGS